MTKTTRVYKIEMLIRSRGHVSLQTLIDELEVSRATLKRDLDVLRDELGAPIVYDPLLGGYRFDDAVAMRGAKHELPGLWFSERELYALLMANQLLHELDPDGALGRHMRPLLDRIDQMLGRSGSAGQPVPRGGRRQGRPGAPSTHEADARVLLRRIRIVSPARRPVESRWFELIGEALVKRQRIHMRYLTRGRGAVGERDVSPQRLVHHRNTWYLDAWCHGRERLLRFALDAIEDANALDAPAHDLPLEQVEAEMDAGYGIYAGGDRRWATLVFDAQAAQWVSREVWHAEQRSRWLASGDYELQVPYTDETELVMDVLRHGEQVRVAEPPALARAVALKLAAAAARYGDTP